MLAHGFPQGRFWRACSWQRVRTRRFAHARAQVLHLSNCQTCVVGNHNDARAFEDLAEFLDHFLFLGSIHSFTPSYGRVYPSGSFSPAIAPALRVLYGSLAKSPEGLALQKLVRFPSQAGLMTANLTHRLGRRTALPPAPFLPPKGQ